MHLLQRSGMKGTWNITRKALSSKNVGRIGRIGFLAHDEYPKLMLHVVIVQDCHSRLLDMQRLWPSSLGDKPTGKRQAIFFSVLAGFLLEFEAPVLTSGAAPDHLLQAAV